MDVSPPTRTIAVTGHGKVSVTPDEAHIQIGVQAMATTAREASASANQAMNEVLTALKSSGVAEQAIQTGYFSIRPEFEHNDGRQRRIGHAAANTVNVTITALDTLGAILDAVVDAGGDNILINNVAFAASEPVARQAHTNARQAALIDARKQAELIAQTMGITLGAVLTITTSNSTGIQPMQRGAQRMYAGAFNSGPAPIQVGEMDVTDSVQVVFAIAD